MRGTPSCNTTSACLPMARNTWQQASAEPTASPSGRACEVSTKRSRCPICRSTSSRMSLGLISTRFLVGLVSLASPFQQLFHSSLGLLGAVETEIQLRRAPEAQPLYQFMANVFASCFQPRQTSIGFPVIAFDMDPYLSRASVIRHVNRRHAHQADSRIGQLPLDQSLDLLAQSLADPSAMVLEAALLHFPPRVKRMRISENWMQMLCRPAGSGQSRSRPPGSRISAELTRR